MIRQIQKQKQAQLDLTSLAIAVVVLGIVVSVGATVLINVRDTTSVGTPSYNVSNLAASGLGEYGNWFKVIVIVGIAGCILALIFLAFGGGANQNPNTSSQY